MPGLLFLSSRGRLTPIHGLLRHLRILRVGGRTPSRRRPGGVWERRSVRTLVASLALVALAACASHPPYAAPRSIQYACNNGHHVDRGDVERLIDAIHGIENAPSYGVNDPNYPQRYLRQGKDGVIARYADLHLPAILADGTHGLVDDRVLHVSGVFSTSDEQYDREVMLFVTHIRPKVPGGKPYGMWVFFDTKLFDVCGKMPWTGMWMQHGVDAIPNGGALRDGLRPPTRRMR